MLIFDQKILYAEFKFFVSNLMNVFPMYVSNLHITDLVPFSLVLIMLFRSYSVFLLVVFHQKIIFSKTKITGPRWFHFWKSELLSKKSYKDPIFFLGGDSPIHKESKKPFNGFLSLEKKISGNSSFENLGPNRTDRFVDPWVESERIFL